MNIARNIPFAHFFIQLENERAGKSVLASGDRGFVARIKVKTTDLVQVMFLNEKVNQPLVGFHRVLLLIHSDALCRQFY